MIEYLIIEGPNYKKGWIDAQTAGKLQKKIT